MCLTVRTSHIKKPIAVMKCVKHLEYRCDRKKSAWSPLRKHEPMGFYTPYRYIHVPIDNGWFVSQDPNVRSTGFYRYETIYGGYLHSYSRLYYGRVGLVSLPTKKSHHETFFFAAYAFDVVAKGENKDLVSRRLYIPAFDKTPELTNQWLKVSKIVLPV